MAIRLRTVNGIRVALCAVESDPMPGDVYLDDSDHHALSTKFGLDWQAMGFIETPPIDEDVEAAMATQKLRDAKEELHKWLAEQEIGRLFNEDFCTDEDGPEADLRYGKD